MKNKKDDYFDILIYKVLLDNPSMLVALKTSEDNEKIYTPLGYIDKKKLRGEK